MQKKASGSRVLFLALIIGILNCANFISAEESAIELFLAKKEQVLYPPFKIIDTMLYKEDGTTAVIVEDSHNENLVVCYGTSIKMPRKKRSLYVGATHPYNTGAQEISRGSDTESLVLKILKSAKIEQGSAPHIKKDLLDSLIRSIEKNK